MTKIKGWLKIELVYQVIIHLHVSGNYLPEEDSERFVVFRVTVGSKITYSCTLCQDV